jgi:predicted GH43/DUF377 family glycosyl hydrolase
MPQRLKTDWILFAAVLALVLFGLLGVSDSWILQPQDPWEVTGYVHNVVFTCGAVPEPDGTVKIYWGGADTVMCVGEANIADLVVLCLEHGRPAK